MRSAIVLVLLVVGLARADESTIRGPSGWRFFDASREHLMVIAESEVTTWPGECYLRFNEHGDIAIVGNDPTPCADKLETAARLARATQRVNRSMRKKAVR